jgi:toluene monooxygenase system ferredoxin subunit
MTWKNVCSLNALEKGQIVEHVVDGVRVVVVRGENHVVVIPPLCPHLEEPLRDGFCDGRTLTCQKHLWQWELESGNPLGEARKALKRYMSKVEGGEVLAFIEREILYDYD